MANVAEALAKVGLDKEEARITQLLARLDDEIAKARLQLEEVQIARKVFERIHGEPAKPDDHTTSGGAPAENPAPEPATPSEALTIKDAALRALKSAHPKGYQKAGVEYWIEKNLKQKVNSASLSVMLGRLRDDDGSARNNGNIWFYVPEKDRKPAE